MLQRSWAFEGERQRNNLDTSMGARRVPTPLVGHYLFGMWEEKKLFPIVMEPGQVVFTSGKEMTKTKMYFENVEKVIQLS